MLVRLLSCSRVAWSSMMIVWWVAGSVLFSLSAAAQIPTQVPFQGLLLDASGAPVNDAVDLDFELFDAITNGNSLWVESHLGVTVVDGVYSLNLGSQTALTQSILAGGSAFLEITVSGETLVPRQQLLSVPYALVAEEAVGIVGVPAAVFQQVWDLFPFDGQEPPNQDPLEGLVDTDADGIPNYLDDDNDNDGISDGAELAAGSSINLISPRIDSVSPDSIVSFAPTTLVVSGTNLETLTSVSFGGESPTPGNLTPTGFTIDVVAETLATSEPITLSIANGEAGSSQPVTIQAVAPTISQIDPPFAATEQMTLITISGTGFYPGTTVEIGSQTLVPITLTDSSLTVNLASEPIGETQVEVIHPNTLSATLPYSILPAGQKIVFLSDTQTSGNLGGVAGANALCQSDAVAAGLTGTFSAWISESAAGGSSSPAMTFPQNVGPYITVTGQTIADDFGDLTDGTLDVPIGVTASGTTGVASFVWTGTRSDGTAEATPSDTCNEWTSTAATASVGTSSQTSSVWTGGFLTGVSCQASFRIYCVEQ